MSTKDIEVRAEAATLEEIGAKHRLNRPCVEYPARCKACHQPWPCDASALLAELKMAREEYERLTVGFESLRQSLTVMQPEYEALKETLAAVEEWQQRLHLRFLSTGNWHELYRILKGGA